FTSSSFASVVSLAVSSVLSAALAVFFSALVLAVLALAVSAGSVVSGAAVSSVGVVTSAVSALASLVDSAALVDVPLLRQVRPEKRRRPRRAGETVEALLAISSARLMLSSSAVASAVVSDLASAFEADDLAA